MAVSGDERLASLTNAIIHRTKDGLIEWDKTSVEGTYSTTIGNYIVHIEEQYRSGSMSPDYIITLYDRLGVLIERYADTDLVGSMADGYDGFYSAMAALYKRAAQQASGANEAIDEILRILRDG